MRLPHFSSLPHRADSPSLTRSACSVAAATDHSRCLWCRALQPPPPNHLPLAKLDALSLSHLRICFPCTTSSTSCVLVSMKRLFMIYILFLIPKRKGSSPPCTPPLHPLHQSVLGLHRPFALLNRSHDAIIHTVKSFTQFTRSHNVPVHTFTRSIVYTTHSF